MEIAVWILVGLVAAQLLLMIFRVATSGDGFTLPRWSTEPARIIGAIEAAIAVALSFNLGLTTEQQAAILSLAVALLVGSEVTRSRVTPAKK